MSVPRAGPSRQFYSVHMKVRLKRIEIIDVEKWEKINFPYFPLFSLFSPCFTSFIHTKSIRPFLDAVTSNLNYFNLQSTKLDNFNIISTNLYPQKNTNNTLEIKEIKLCFALVFSSKKFYPIFVLGKNLLVRLKLGYTNFTFKGLLEVG